MNTKSRNRIRFWILAIIPLFALPGISSLYGSIWMVLFLLFYLFIYRPMIDTQRLISLGKIEEKDAWKFFIPLQVNPIPYLRPLWLD